MVFAAAFGLLNGLVTPQSKELSPTSRKGSVMGSLLRKFQEVGSVPKNVEPQLQPQRGH